MKVVVTGSGGYVGCVLVPMLLAQGHRVLVFDSLRKGGLGLLPHFANPHLEFIRGDVRDAGMVQSALKGADVIIHLAAIVGYPACQRDPWLARQVNVEGTANIARCRSRSQLILFASSLSNFGTSPGDVCTEETPPAPISLYGATKLEGEKLLMESGNVIIFRPATAFGLSPQMRLDLLFNDFVYRALKERHLVVYQPHFMRAFIHVSDLARAFLFAMDNPGQMKDQIYNLGSQSLNVTKGELAQRIRNRIEFDLNLSEVGEDPDRRNYRVDFSKLRSLGYQTRVSIEDGIEELVRGLQVIDIPNPFVNTNYL